MNTLNQIFEKMESWPNVTQEIAHLFKLRFLDIMSREDEKKLIAWIDANESNNSLLRLWLKLSKKKTARAFSIEQRIKEVAAYANITPRAMELLHYIFLDIETDEETEELDNWSSEKIANNRLLDLLLEFNFQNSSTETIALLRMLFKEANPQDIFSLMSLYGIRLIATSNGSRLVNPKQIFPKIKVH